MPVLKTGAFLSRGREGWEPPSGVAGRIRCSLLLLSHKHNGWDG